MHSIDVYRGPDLLATIYPDNSSTQLKKIMGDNQLNISFEDSRHIPFKVGDHCTAFGETYRINKLPAITKLSEKMFKYSFVMQSEGYDLSKVQYLFLGSDNSLRETGIPFTETARGFMDLLFQNINRVLSGWSLGQVIETGYKTMTFKSNCYNALVDIAAAFDTEFWIEGKTVHLTKRSNDTGRTFRQGRFQGFYDLTRGNVDNSSVITRLYACGSEKNLPPLYDSNRLHMPGRNPGVVYGVTVDAVPSGSDTVFTFHWIEPLATDASAVTVQYKLSGTSDWTNSTAGATSPRVLTLPTGTYDVKFRTEGGIYAGSTTDIIQVSGPITTPVLLNTYLAYVEKNTGEYGIIEGVQTFDDIYPHRTGKITSVDATNIYKVTDYTMDFDLNAYLLPGREPKITFNTGQLKGYTFNISRFDNGSKEFTILRNADETALDIPNSSIKAAIGDEYVLTDIYLPQTYIDAAELELQEAALKLLDEISQPQVSYNCNFDPVFLRDRKISLAIGDLVWIEDSQFLLNRRIRITSITRNILNENSLQIEMADVITAGKIDNIISTQNDTTRTVGGITNTLQNRDIFNGRLILPETSSTAGMYQVYVDGDGKLWRKV